jgi:signal transduction histidine kinase
METVTMPHSLAWLRLVLLPPLRTDLVVEPGSSVELAQARERILTTLLRVGALFGSFAFVLTLPLMLALAQPGLVLVYLFAVSVIWAAALHRSLAYSLRATVVLAVLYGLSLIELLNFGYSEDSIAYLTAFTLFVQLFFGWRAGVIALGLSMVTLGSVGVALSTQRFAPLVMPLKRLDIAPMLITCAVFFAVVGAVVAGIAVLLQSLELAWRNDLRLRLALEGERLALEQRVEERTAQLVAARDQERASSALLVAQNRYLETLRQTTVDLLNRQDLDDVLQRVVEHATEILDAPYGALVLVEGDELVALAHTSNQPFRRGARAARDEASLSWLAYDTIEPVTVDDYSTWPARRDMYDEVQLRAVAEFPVAAGGRCLGVLSMGRTTPAYPFSASQCAQGVLFSQLAAVVLENARLNDNLRAEVAERRRAYAALQATAEALQAQNAELDAFAHTVAHDIKSPLTSIVGYAQLLHLTYPQLSYVQIDEYLDKITTNGMKTATIVDALLLLASTSAKHPVELRPLATDSLVRSLVPRLQPLIDQHDARVVLPDSWPTARGYAPWVEEVWVNYISNAIKYGGPKPVVFLGADAPSEGFVRYWVRDHGPGLSAEQQARLFTPFTRLHLDLAPGHGLGLSIVRRIVDRLGGTVGVESVVGQGSTFSFTLPVAER